MTRGRCGSLCLHRMKLSFTTPHRLWPAHDVTFAVSPLQFLSPLQFPPLQFQIAVLGDAVQEILRQGHGHGRSEDTDKFHPAAMHCRSKSPTSSNEPRRDFRHVIQGRSWETISESAIYATGSCKALVVLSSATRINPGETASRPVSK